MKKSLLLVLPFMALGVVGCQSNKKEKDNVELYPTYIAYNDNWVGKSIFIDGVDFTENIEEENRHYVFEMIRGLDPYEEVESIESETSQSFSLLFTSSKEAFTECKLDYYVNGYVKLAAKNDKEDQKRYYKFDRNIIAAYRMLATGYGDMKEERAKAYERANKLDINSVIDALKADTENLTLRHIITDGPGKETTITDDGSIKELLINAKYTLYESNTGPLNVDARQVAMRLVNTVYDAENDYTWIYNILIDEQSSIVGVSVNVQDKYFRQFGRTLHYTMEQETVTAIIDKTIELYQQQKAAN